MGQELDFAERQNLVDIETDSPHHGAPLVDC